MSFFVKKTKKQDVTTRFETSNNDISIQSHLTEESKENDTDIIKLYDAIKELTEIDRGIILLYLEKKTYKEIAEIMGTNSNSIGVKITRIKKRLKKQLTKKIIN